VATAHANALPVSTVEEIGALYHKLIDAENRHISRRCGPWCGNPPTCCLLPRRRQLQKAIGLAFWGTEVVMQKLRRPLYGGTFVMAPHYDRMKTVGLIADVAETYAPLDITVAYAGQTPVPKPFLMIVTWLRTPAGWKMATDIALVINPKGRDRVFLAFFISEINITPEDGASAHPVDVSDKRPALKLTIELCLITVRGGAYAGCDCDRPLHPQALSFGRPKVAVQ
jgi:hypothetical protein